MSIQCLEIKNFQQNSHIFPGFKQQWKPIYYILYSLCSPWQRRWQNPSVKQVVKEEV